VKAILRPKAFVRETSIVLSICVWNNKREV
jgi:hypothetical protein